MKLEEKLRQLPDKPGVYQYFDKNNKLLYIGKAKSLKNRVKSYFRFTPTLQPSPTLGSRIYKMVSEVSSLNYIIVESENDALILENSLIKQLKPKYNILLRDDKTYPYIYVDFDDDFPRLEITRKILKKKSIKYYGPFSSGAKDLLNSIYEIVPLVQKKSCIKGNEACMFYQIKRCLAPCEGKVSKEEYKKFLEEAIEYLTNKTRIIQKLQEKMELYSEQFRFEEAMVLRDRIQTISKSQIKSTLDFAKSESFDLFCVEQGDKKAVAIKMFVRDGKLISTDHTFINTTEITTKDEIYKTIIINYYNQELPKIESSIIVCDEIEYIEDIKSFVQNKYNKNINISTPKKGLKKSLVELAKKNSVELLKINNTITKDIYNELRDLFKLYKIPYRFECFDNSQMMGQAKVGAMIVWDDNKFDKDSYRLYNLEANDEYAQMKELLTRRVNSFDKNSPPDLWVIDGGRTLLNLAYDIIDSYGVNLDVIAIAKEKVDAKAYRSKGAANDILYTKDEIYRLKPSDKRLQFIQRLRDEAHRSAITFHKKQKRKEDKNISLLNIHGIGEAKIKKLISFFGEFEEIKKASFEELSEVVSKTDAKNILEYFKTIDKS